MSPWHAPLTGVGQAIYNTGVADERARFANLLAAARYAEVNQPPCNSAVPSDAPCKADDALPCTPCAVRFRLRATIAECEGQP